MRSWNPPMPIWSSTGLRLADAVTPLPAVAWIGRFLTWGLLAWSWQRLSSAVAPRRWWRSCPRRSFLLFSQRVRWRANGWWAAWRPRGLPTSSSFWRWRRCCVNGGARLGFGWGGDGVSRAGRRLVPGRRRLCLVIVPASAADVADAWCRACWWAVAGAGRLAPGTRPARTASVRTWQRDANLIYVYGRLVAPLLFYTFPRAAMLSQALLLAVWLAAVTPRPADWVRQPGAAAAARVRRRRGGHCLVRESRSTRRCSTRRVGGGPAAVLLVSPERCPAAGRRGVGAGRFLELAAPPPPACRALGPGHGIGVAGSESGGRQPAAAERPAAGRGPAEPAGLARRSGARRAARTKTGSVCRWIAEHTDRRRGA